jgi:hypothetical protein
VETYRIDFIIARDDAFARRLGARAVSATFLVSLDGTVVRRLLGPAGFGRISAAIEDIL